MGKEIEALALRAREGCKEALDALIKGVYDDIFGLALRMLGYPSDAQDATQEIVIKIITHLEGFRAQSSFKTWSYRIAVNHLQSFRSKQAASMGFSFELWEELAYRDDPDFDYSGFSTGEMQLLKEEVRIGCMQGMLQCLDDKTRLVIILGMIFEMTSQEGAQVLDISPEAFRKRLSRGRQQIIEFMRKNCSLFENSNHCRCEKLIGPDINDQWIDPDNLMFSGPGWNYPAKEEDASKSIEAIHEIGRVAMLLQNYPTREAGPDSVVHIVQKIIDLKHFKILEGGMNE